ncbi:MAG: protein phosphatase [Chloroflexi bacterium]|nr:protein phosphatase [Chloroflexota bacterium]
MLEELLRFVRKGFARVAELSPTRLNLSWITEQVAVGGAFHMSEIPRLEALGIRGVVDCRKEASDDAEALGRRGIAYLRLPTPDAHALTQAALDAGVQWVLDCIERGEKVYVHCGHGVGRAPLLGCSVLVAQGRSFSDALAEVKARRWQASPNEEQVGALREFARRSSETAQGAPPPVRTS